MSAFLKVFVAVAALTAASSNLAFASYESNQVCQDHAYTHCR
ncbi:hypothetical protein [Hyphomicrobium sp. 802]|jgi:hypothetical protein|nr:hypothetical protein [Hyphomicrobium sp. 802]